MPTYTVAATCANNQWGKPTVRLHPAGAPDGKQVYLTQQEWQPPERLERMQGLKMGESVDLIFRVYRKQDGSEGSVPEFADLDKPLGTPTPTRRPTNGKTTTPAPAVNGYEVAAQIKAKWEMACEIAAAGARHFKDLEVDLSEYCKSGPCSIFISLNAAGVTDLSGAQPAATNASTDASPVSVATPAGVTIASAADFF